MRVRVPVRVRVGVRVMVRVGLRVPVRVGARCRGRDRDRGVCVWADVGMRRGRGRERG